MLQHTANVCCCGCWTNTATILTLYTTSKKHFHWALNIISESKRSADQTGHTNTHIHTHTHTHTCSNPTLAHRWQITQCCTYTRSLHVQAIYTTHGKKLKPDRMTQLRRFFMKFVRSYSSSYCFSSHKSGSVSNTLFIVRALDATGWFLEDFWLSFFLSSSENKSNSWKQTQDINTETGRRNSWHSR